MDDDAAVEDHAGGGYGRPRIVSFKDVAGEDAGELRREPRTALLPASDATSPQVRLQAEDCNRSVGSDSNPRSTDDIIGRRFGQPGDEFEILKEVGKGGQATVYECVRLKYDERYAAKIYDMILPQCKKDERDRRLSNMRREIRVMRELWNHKFVNLYEAFYEPITSPRECILVIDLCTGGDLHSLVKKEGDAAAEAGSTFRGLGGAEVSSKYIAKQILEGLGYMHEKQVIHRDLKLDNILITRSFPATATLPGLPSSETLPDLFHDVKIADLGLSREMATQGVETQDGKEQQEKSQRLKRTMTPVGTHGYFAPEILERRYDERADFWSFGVMLFSMLTARPPFMVQPWEVAPRRYKDAVRAIQENEAWQLATVEAKEFVKGLLTIDPNERLNLDSCLHHAWLEAEAQDSHVPRKTSSFAGQDVDTGVIEEVRGRIGYALDSVTLELWDGTFTSHGGKGGVSEKRFALAADELIVAVMQEARHEYLGNGLVFYTSAGRILPIAGTEMLKRARFMAPSDCQIVGLQFQEHLLAGIHIEDKPAPGEHGAVAQISGRAGHAVDKVVLELRNGKVRSYGGNGGTEQGPWAMHPEEYIIIVEQIVQNAYLGHSIVFYTSRGNIIRLVGMTKGTSHRFVAPQGRQICGLEFKGSQLVRTWTCPKYGNLGEKSVHNCV